MSFLPGSKHTPRGRRDAGQPATTEAFPTADPPPLRERPTGTGQADDGEAQGALAALDDGQTSFQGDPLPAPAEDELFVPKSRYVMGRSTKVMACILMVTAGLFAGSAIQKQIDAGTRAARTNTANFQGNGAGAGAGSGAGTQTPGPGRPNGGSGSGPTAPGSPAPRTAGGQ